MIANMIAFMIASMIANMIASSLIVELSPLWILDGSYETMDWLR